MSTLLNMLNRFIDNPIMIGISPDMDNTKRHGIIHVRGENKVVQLGFISDDVNRLQVANAKEIKNIFTQVELLGYQPISMEIRKPNGRVAWYDYKAA